MRILGRLLILIFCVSFFHGCSMPQLREVTGQFPGLRPSMDSGRRIKLLVVHGIGDHKPGYAETLVNSIANEMEMDPEFKFSIQEIRRLEGSEAEGEKHVRTYGYLRVQDYYHRRTDQVMRMYELTWSPTTQPVKDQFLGFDSMGKHQYERIFLNQQLKVQMMNERMAEAVLYVGKYRKEMQYPILWTLKYMLDDAFGSGSDEIAIITASLGSYMLFDTVMSLPNQNDGSFEADELLTRLHTVIMLANQLPLLLLGEVSQIGDNLGQALPNPQTEKQTHSEWFEYPILQRFIELRNSVFERNAPGKPIPELSLVAINDPNDLLSYPLPGYLDRDGDHLNYVNVSLNIARITPITQIANPITAHTGHEANEDVIHFIVNGTFKSTEEMRE